MSDVTSTSNPIRRCACGADASTTHACATGPSPTDLPFGDGTSTGQLVPFAYGTGRYAGTSVPASMPRELALELIERKLLRDRIARRIADDARTLATFDDWIKATEALYGN